METSDSWEDLSLKLNMVLRGIREMEEDMKERLRE
jgi:hypothetical protein